MKHRTLFATLRHTAMLALTVALVTLAAPAAHADQLQPSVDTQPVIEQELPEVPTLEQQIAEHPVTPPQNMSHQPCIQVITWGKQPGTGECVQFPTPCDVPAGWETFSSLEACQAADS